MDVKDFHKGDVVEVRGQLYTFLAQSRVDYDRALYKPPIQDYASWRRYGQARLRCLDRYSLHKPYVGMVVGYSWRGVGYSTPPSGGSSYGQEYDDFDPGGLGITERVPVVMVIPLSSERFVKPVPVLPEDLAPIEDYGPDARVAPAVDERQLRLPE
jgi:hypothetical protein